MKKVLILIGLVVTALLGLLLGVVLLINPNQFKPMLVEQTKATTGLDIAIDGDIHWRVFPSIGLQLGNTVLRNPNGFSSPEMFKIDQIGIDIAFFPLLTKHLKLGKIRLNGPEVYLETLKDGRSNLDTIIATLKNGNQLTEYQQATPGVQTVVSHSKPAQPDPEVNLDEIPESRRSIISNWTMSVAGVEVTNGRLDIRNQQSAKVTEVYDVNFDMSQFELEKWTSIQFSARVIDGALQVLTKGVFQINVDLTLQNIAISDIKVDSTVEGESIAHSPLSIALLADTTYDLYKKEVRVSLNQLSVNDTQIDGSMLVQLTDKPKITIDLHNRDLDLDALFSKPVINASEAAQPSNLPPESVPDQPVAVTHLDAPSVSVAAHDTIPSEPDLSVLSQLDLTAKITLDRVKANQVEMKNVSLQFAIKHGMVLLNTFKAHLYQGSLLVSGQLDTRQSPATYRINNTISGVQIQPLLMALAGKNILEGTGNIVANLQGSSLIPSKAKRNIHGTAELKVTNGAVKGINVAQMIRTNYARIKGSTVSGGRVQKTDFSALTATFRIANGEMHTSDLSLYSPLLRVEGEGRANYIEKNLNLLIRTSLVGSLEGQGGKSADELKDITIPMKVSGDWDNLKYKLVVDDVLKEKAKKELNRGLDKLDGKIKDEKTREAVKSILGSFLK
jgi:AsmA protein